MCRMGLLFYAIVSANQIALCSCISDKQFDYKALSLYGMTAVVYASGNILVVE